MRVHVVDPPAYTPPYDHALSAALARAGASVELITGPFPHGEVRRGDGYRVVEAFYRRSPGGDRARRALRVAQHVPDMLRYARYARRADVVHFQWLSLQQVDHALLPRRHPRLLTAHDVVPREARPGQRGGQKRLYERMDAVIVHSEHGARRLREEVGLDPARVHVIPHGAFHDLAALHAGAPLPPELLESSPGGAVGRHAAGSGPLGPVALCFGLMRPYKGLDVLLEAWREVEGAVLWIVGAPRMDIGPLRAASPAGVRWVPRFVSSAELAATFRHADVVVLPYREIDQSGVLFTALAFGKPLLLTAVGGFPEIAATGAAELVPPEDAAALADALRSLLSDGEHRERLAAAARAAAAPDGPHGWDSIARRTLALYEALG